MKIVMALAALFLSACSLLQTKVDSTIVYKAPGFEYNFPKTGEWVLGSSKPGNIVIGKKVEGDGISVLATVKYGPIGLTPTEMAEFKKNGTIKAHSTTEIISSFKANIEKDAQIGRVKNMKSKFDEQKLDNGSCLVFSQLGDDGGTMPISNDGKWCFNSKTYSYIMLNMSARAPEGKRLPNVDLEKNEFFSSLVLTKQ